MVIQVLTLMPLRTTMNYQYRCVQAPDKDYADTLRLAVGDCISSVLSLTYRLR